MTTAVFLFGLIYLLKIHNVESTEVACPRGVTGLVDGSVTIQCSYSTIPTANKYARKFICQQGGKRGNCKSTIISTSPYVDSNFSDRASIEDDPNEGTITIKLDQLQTTDEGTYFCGIGDSSTHKKMAEIRVSVTKDSVLTTEAQLLYSHLRGTMKFRCEVGKQNAARKYLCKIGKAGCMDIIDSLGKVASVYQGRILLQTDENEPGWFTVKIAQLRNEDSGLYACGWGTYGKDGDATNFDLRIHYETDIPQGPRSLSSRLGGSVSAECKYNPKKNYTDKFWCKLEESFCNPIIKTDGYVGEAYEGRVVIHDNATDGTMQILMNQITKEDEGWYWCVLTDGKRDQTSTVQLKILEDERVNLEGLKGNKTIEVTAGEKATIPCSYPCRFKSHEKYWCKWGNSGCKPVTSHDDVQNELSISCVYRELLLTFNEVSKKDSGWYWCGVIKSGRYGETIAMQIRVKDPIRIEPRSNINPRGNVGENRNIQVIVTPPSSDSSRNSTVVAAVVSVCAAFLVVSAVFIFFRMRRRKNSDLVSVGSYRTNISLTDLDNGIGKENPAVIETEETDISHSKDGPKIKKKGSQEELDYSSFLIQHNGSPNEALTS
ncbi:polymeric immunoglobulin receptor-like [Mixophyes fleayi]|uniref:polymeric immunoglobulin receptor-like n=1 Tax=Mixophyes fleayi TaxID=3061075 RepID=UPI003F4DDB43